MEESLRRFLVDSPAFQYFAHQSSKKATLAADKLGSEGFRMDSHVNLSISNLRRNPPRGDVNRTCEVYASSLVSQHVWSL